MMNMPGIIVGIDGSPCSHRALEWAVHEAVIRKDPLTVLTVRQTTAGFLGSAAARSDDYEESEQARKTALAEVEEVLDQVVGDSRPTTVGVQAVLGLPAEELLKAAVEADMIVVGSRGCGGFKKLSLGSVSSQLVHHGHCPVVVIPS